MSDQSAFVQRIRFMIGLLIFISPTFVMIFEQGNTVWMALISLLALVFLPLLPSEAQLLRQEKILLLILVLFFLSDLVFLLSSDIRQMAFNRWIFLFFIACSIPIYLFLRRLQINPSWLWTGLVLGSVGLSLKSVFPIWPTDLSLDSLTRHSVVSHKMLLGNLSLLMGVMTWGGWPWFKTKRTLLALPVLALIMGFLACLFVGFFYPRPDGVIGLSTGESIPSLGKKALWDLAPLMLLLAFSSRQFFQAINNESGKIRALGLAGLVLIPGIIYFFFVHGNNSSIMPLSFLIWVLILWMSILFNEKVYFKPLRIDRKQSLSVIIITKDEEDRIESCLESVSNWADEIIVLDSGSTDRTVALVKKYADKVYITDWPGYGPQKQRALEKAAGDWVLSIDADEQVTPELRDEIDRCLRGTPQAIAFRIPWAVHIFGKRLDFGRSGRSPLRLFKREGARFSDAQVHEKIILPNGPIGRLEGRLLHFTHRNMLQGLDKFVQYSWLWAKQRHEKGKRTGIVNALLHSCWEFFNIYFIRLGFLDGRRGLLMAILFWQYTFNKYASLWSLNTSVYKKK